MSDDSQPCPKCSSPYGYQDRGLWICPECAHEWVLEAAVEAEEVVAGPKFLDANGVQLQSGDTVRTTKDLKVGGETLKSGTKVKGIRLLEDPVDGHDIACKIDGFGSMYLKCSVVRKDS
ncbi:MAG: alkylphosphonate utilization protein [Bdellovibrio sp. CG12_big_fil_rev_8_21_14_0_65_39_13]|nr:MAG: alkylphosphonate utilization protein [Bdellovibrio sp. CG22_combo_CG10-13_8_21_14_all_39_27]PIQ62173.1 MAG: alkylphosphonate utilization protein [Bdellovibrio sp. CG12_big_fil_rev_8_21_14_0_65_39_13]PIR34184.1 MAG: alkylphosphonate utilization protein [Bdellovibrio sp. CG11_big_fil_rev_8_21_14_0_20_39_38]PJB52684.1 MAG: alkylphosphonate utilization protein [Bdellovibrio sp. CG_4_9_14_3_um_filter_39_7]